MPTSRGFLLSLMPSSPSLEWLAAFGLNPAVLRKPRERYKDHGDTENREFEFSLRVLRVSVVISIIVRHGRARADDRLDDIDGGGDRREGIRRRRRAGGGFA